MTTTTRRTIILTDDDEDDRDIFIAALKSGHSDVRLLTFADGEALRQYMCEKSAELPHLIFLDINMPRMNGFECLSKLREKYSPQQIPVVMYTTSNHQADHDKAAQLGANMYLHKPNNYPAVKELINKVLQIDWRQRPMTSDNFLM